MPLPDRPHTALTRLSMVAVLCLCVGNRAAAQATLTLTAGAATAGTMPTPLRANYESGSRESGSPTGTWTLSVNCGNIGICIATAKLATGAVASTLTSVKVTYTVPNDNNCLATPGVYSVTVSSTTAIDLFSTKKKELCTVSAVSFVVNNLSYTSTSYQSSASASTLATQQIVFGSR